MQSLTRLKVGDFVSINQLQVILQKSKSKITLMHANKSLSHIVNGNINNNESRELVNALILYKSLYTSNKNKFDAHGLFLT